MKALSQLLLLGFLTIPFVSRVLGVEATTIALSTNIEDGKKMFVATVTAQGKPVENAKVSFYAKRMFGALTLGSETTLDDGTAAVPFPSTLPGDNQGRLLLSAELSNSPKHAVNVRAEAVFDGGTPFQAKPIASPPRALWASRAPFILLAAIAALVGLVWSAFAYVVIQLNRIRKETEPT